MRRDRSTSSRDPPPLSIANRRPSRTDVVLDRATRPTCQDPARRLTIRVSRGHPLRDRQTVAEKMHCRLAAAQRPSGSASARLVTRPSRLLPAALKRLLHHQSIGRCEQRACRCASSRDVRVRLALFIRCACVARAAAWRASGVVSVHLVTHAGTR